MRPTFVSGPQTELSSPILLIFDGSKGKVFTEAIYFESFMVKKSNKRETSAKLNTTIQSTVSSRHPGRNSYSNIIRYFLKLCETSGEYGLIFEQFQKVARLNSFFISFVYFKIRMKEVAPDHTNYIKTQEFFKSCQDKSEFSKAVRILFRWFLRNFWHNHLLTWQSRYPLAKTTIKCFLSCMRTIENEIFHQAKVLEENTKQKSN